MFKVSQYFISKLSCTSTFYVCCSQALFYEYECSKIYVKIVTDLSTLIVNDANYRFELAVKKIVYKL